jgi:putative OPT family oligopeptide transporter
VLGVVVASFVVPPILDLLYNAYGIGGVFPRPGMNKDQMLGAPQAALMAAVAQGVYTHHLNWIMIIIGSVIAVVCIFIDEIAKNYDTRLPVLAVGLGIYLPMSTTVPVMIGGFLSYFIQRQLNKRYDQRLDNQLKGAAHRQRGLLLACGVVAGASIMGVVLAIPFAIKQSSDALKIMPDSLAPFAGVLSIGVTALLCWWIYSYVMRDKVS